MTSIKAIGEPKDPDPIRGIMDTKRSLTFPETFVCLTKHLSAMTETTRITAPTAGRTREERIPERIIIIIMVPTGVRIVKIVRIGTKITAQEAIIRTIIKAIRGMRREATIADAM